RGGGAHRARLNVLRRGGTAGEGAGSGAQTRIRRANGAALDQVQPQQLAAHGGTLFRCLSRAGDAGLYRPGGERRPRLAAREEKTQFSAGTEGFLAMRRSPLVLLIAAGICHAQPYPNKPIKFVVPYS